MGCLRRIGCAILLIVLAGVAWWARDLWLPEKYREIFAPSVAAGPWHPLSDSGATRTEAALDRLSKPRGAVFETLSGADVVSFAMKTVIGRLPGDADSVETRVIGSLVAVRARVKTADLPGVNKLGAVLSEREWVELDGNLRVDQPGLAVFDVQDAKLRGIGLPRGIIAAMVSHMTGSDRPQGLSNVAIPLPLPRYVGDIRVANGKITLYKTVQ